MALVATPGDPDANSYLTVAEADEYFSARLHAGAWTAADNATKEAALIWATRLVDANICFVFSSATSTQSLLWPMLGARTVTGRDIPGDEVPSAVKYATAELALLLLAGDRTAQSDVAALGLTRLKAGPVELGFADSSQSEVVVIPQTVKALLPVSWLCPEPTTGRRTFMEAL